MIGTTSLKKNVKSRSSRTTLRRSQSRFSYFGDAQNARKKELKALVKLQLDLAVRILDGEAIYVTQIGTPYLPHNKNWTSHHKLPSAKILDR